MKKYLSTICSFIVILLTLLALYLLLIGKIIDIPYGTKEGGFLLAISGIIIFAAGITLVRLIKIIEKKFHK